MKNKALILCFLYFCFLKCRCVDQASFYGNSFIALPFKEARSSTDINFKFKTHLSSALIFLVAGNTDYCIVQLEKGRIKVNINLGSGEAEVVSPGNLKLNDLKWHEVSIERRDANLTLIIDKSHKVQKHLPGKFFELNIHYGLFIGDNKNRNNTDIFFGHLEKFRGCISELKYNGILVLDQARYRQSESIVQGITWNCAAEFDASVDQPISFIEDDSYVLISDKITNKKALNINFEVKTTKTNGLLFYNTGKKIKQDFLLIELSNESIISIIKINEKTTKLSSKNIKVSDGEWHKISVQMLPIVVELTIDETVFSEKNIHGSVFQMADTSFIGGLENSKRFRATQKGCSDSCDTSFKGCLRYLTISDVKKGIPDAQVTEGIMPGCLWHYPCLQNPCSNNGVCIQQGLDSFHCQCKEEFCVNLNYSEGYKVFSESSLATDLELLSVEPLQVLEGQSELLTTNNLHMILDYHKYGITDSGITFFVIGGPEHGSITLDIWPHDKNWFTFHDLVRDKVHYIHDGSEEKHDHLIMEVMFTTSDSFTLPEYLQGRFRFNFSVVVTPTNDPPVLDIADATVLRTVQGTKKFLSSDIFKVIDSDNTPDQLIYSILKCEDGYFENVNNPGTKISSFTQEEVNGGLILFYDKSSDKNTSYISMQVSDGLETSPVYRLRVAISPQYWRMERNTGLIVLHQSVSVITPYNLSFTSNVAIPDYLKYFSIVRKPAYGVVEVEKTGNSWEHSDYFTGNDLKQHRVRYRHTIANPDFDEFQVVKNFTQDDINKGYVSYLNEHLGVNADEVGMKVTCKDAVNIAQLGIWILPSNYWEPLEIKTLNKISVEESTSVLITKKFLEVTQRNVPPSVITYYIVQMPEYGYITILSDVKNAEESVNILTFTQDLVNENKILYVQSTTNQTKDKIIFNITNGVVWNSNFQFNIEIIPERLFLGTSDLIVNEGGIGVLSSAQLFVLTDYYKSKVTSYSIKGNVEYGCIQVHKRCITSKSFSVKDIQAGAVQYLHDGTESTRDQLTVVGETDTKKTSVPITLNIIIFPVNDQKPKIVNNTGLTMWEGGFAYITNEMLAAVDDDKPKEILKYQVQTCWFGIVSLISNITAQLNTFTQDMIDEGLIVFRHYNGTGARFKFNVTDGLHTTKDCIFHIKTKPVEMKLINNPLPIFPLQKKFLTSKHLITVVSDPYRKIEYDVVKAPSLGRLMMESEKPGIFQVISTFSQEDLNTSKVFYEHTHQFSDLYANDSFVFNVRTHLAPKLLNQLFRIDISVSSGGLDAYMNIPKLYVDEGGTITIPLNMSGVVTFLESHAGLRSPIIHASALPPQHGQVYSQQNRNVTTFTQLQLESGQVYYEHDHSDTLGDNIYFSLYLIPGPITLCNVTVPIIVNPVNDQPFVLVTPAPSLVVVQGENRTITRHDLATEDADTPPEKLKYDVISGPSHGKFFINTNADKNKVEFSLKRPPKYGLLYKDNQANLTYFSYADLINGKIMYLQTDMSVSNDSFSVNGEIFSGGNSFGDCVEVVIRVKPFMHIHNLTTKAGETTRLTLNSLNASPLAKLTNGNPRYTIINHPKHGEVRKIIRSSGEKRNILDIAVSSFSHEDIQSGLIFFIVKETDVPKYSFLDRMVFILAANIVQPAVGELKIVVKSPLGNDIFSTLPGPSDPASHEGGLYLASPNMTKDYLLIVSMAVGIVILGIAVIVVIKCRSVDNHISKEEHCVQPIPLPRPPDRLMTSSPSLRESLPDEYAVEFTSEFPISFTTDVSADFAPVFTTDFTPEVSAEFTSDFSSDFTPLSIVPHCKVTPLAKIELESPHMFYPYGVDDQMDDWSEVLDEPEVPEPMPCPSNSSILLRKNQYWV
uniref:Chondroitin sulfate proteoglycan 4 n=1 Tax=Diabrotica virgifera virgifera TaxID=50390 RepID=A0A6P7H1L8_DIAVI